jgi:PAS domain S-box-containing protein
MKTSLRILNLEDSVNDAELNEAMVSARWPRSVFLRVDNRADFVSALDQGGFDLILSDFTMQGFNGLQALELAREKRPEVPFLFVSGTIGEDTAIEALKNGATDYVLKHRLMRLIPAVDRALREAEERAERQRAEETMRQSEHKYRELFESLGDPAFLADEQSGKIIDANRRAEAVLGCKRGDILGRKETRFLSLGETHTVPASPETDLQNTIRSECKLICADGRAIPVEVRSTRLTLYGTALVLRLTHDISGSSEQPWPEKTRFRIGAPLQTSDEAIITNTLDGTITSWNSGAQRIFGYTGQEAVGQAMKMLMPPDRQGEESNILARIKRGEKVDHFKTVHIRKDRQPIVVSVKAAPIRDIHDRIIGVWNIVRDVTEQQEADDQLKALFREISDLKAALDEHAIVAIIDPQGKITRVNDKFCAISKYSRAELCGQDYRLTNSGIHPQEFFHDLWTTIGRGKVWKGEIKNQAKDDSHFWVDTTIVPFLDEQGKPRQFVAIHADITEHKLAEEKIRQLNAELEERVVERTVQLQAANQELEAFSYSVSHDLRAPLRHVMGFVELLQEDAGPVLPEKSRRYLTTISRSAKRMGDLIDDLLAFSRVGRAALQKADISLDKLVREMLDDFKAETNERKIVWKIHPLPAVQADRALLRMVFVNLVANAVKFTGTRDRARIEIGCAHGSEAETVIFIRDNGVGFDPRYAGKLFGVFQRLHSQDEFAGTGIGLANVQRIIHRHGGRTWAEGVVDGGATFYFSLPKKNGGIHEH